MTLQELTEQEIKERVAVGKPVNIIVSPKGFPDYSKRVIAMVNAQAPEGAKGFVVGETKGLPTLVEVKVWGNIIAGEKRPLRREVQTWYTHPVQYFN